MGAALADRDQVSVIEQDTSLGDFLAHYDAEDAATDAHGEIVNTEPADYQGVPLIDVVQTDENEPPSGTLTVRPTQFNSPKSRPTGDKLDIATPQPKRPRKRRRTTTPAENLSHQSNVSPAAGSGRVTPRADGKIDLQILPAREIDRCALQAAEMNPRILLEVRPAKTMRSVERHLKDKWWRDAGSFADAWDGLHLLGPDGSQLATDVTVADLIAAQSHRKNPRLLYKLAPSHNSQGILNPVDLNTFDSSPILTPSKNPARMPFDLSKHFGIDSKLSLPATDSIIHELDADNETFSVSTGVVDCFDIAVDGFNPRFPTVETPTKPRLSLRGAFHSIFGAD